MVKKTERSNWQRCVDFHGHECGGLTIGYKAAQYAIKLLELTFSDDEQVVCIAENDSCSVDAIQVLLGCSMGKGNLLFHITGKQAFSFYNRTSGRSVRLSLRPRPDSMSREESFAYYQSKEPEELFLVGETRIPLPLRGPGDRQPFVRWLRGRDRRRLVDLAERKMALPRLPQPV